MTNSTTEIDIRTVNDVLITYGPGDLRDFDASAGVIGEQLARSDAFGRRPGFRRAAGRGLRDAWERYDDIDRCWVPARDDIVLGYAMEALMEIHSNERGQADALRRSRHHAAYAMYSADPAMAGNMREYADQQYDTAMTALEEMVTLPKLREFVAAAYAHLKKDDASVAEKAESAPADALSVGDCVLHTSFGVGTVTQMQGSGANRKVVIDFGSGGEKKLSLRHAIDSMVKL